MTVFDMAATLTLDTVGFVSSLGKAASSGQNFASKLTGTVNGALKSTQQQISATTVAIGHLISQAAQWTLTSAKTLAGTGWNYNKQMENYTTNFEVMLGSADAAQKKIQELSEFAASTPFSMGDLTGATQTLLAFGVQADLSTTKLKMLGDISLGNADRMNRLSIAYGKASAMGKVTGEVVQSMVDAGFNPLLVLSEKTGESMESLQKRMSEGKVSIQELDQALIYATSAGGRFYQGMERASKTTAGLESTLADNWTVFLAALTKPFNNVYSKTILPALLKAMDKLNDYLEDNADSLERFEGKLGDWATRSIEGIISAFEWITTHGKETSAALGLIGTALGTIYAVTHPVQAGILAVAAGARYITTRWSGVGEWFEKQWGKISKAAVDAWGDEKSGIKGVLTSLWDVMTGKGASKPKTIMEVMGGGAESEQSLSTFATDIGSIATRVGELATSAAGFAWGELKEFLSFLKENKQEIITFAGNISEIALQVGELAGEIAVFSWENLKDFFRTIWENRENIITAAKSIADKMESLWEKISPIAGFAWNTLEGFFNYITDDPKRLEGILTAIGHAFETWKVAKIASNLVSIVASMGSLGKLFGFGAAGAATAGAAGAGAAKAGAVGGKLAAVAPWVVAAGHLAFGEPTEWEWRNSPLLANSPNNPYIKHNRITSNDVSALGLDANSANGYIMSRMWWDIYANRRDMGAASQYTAEQEQEAYNTIDNFMGPGFAERLKQYMENLMLSSGSADGLFSSLKIPIDMFQGQLDDAELTISPESKIDTNAIQEQLSDRVYTIDVDPVIRHFNSGLPFPIPDIPVPDGTTLTQGSHASGFYRVPYNDYHTVLHRDEAVLTRQQAEEWRAGSSYGQQDMSSLVNAFAHSVASMLRGISVNIDGEAAGELLLPYVNSGLGRIAEERRYY